MGVCQPCFIITEARQIKSIVLYVLDSFSSSFQRLYLLVLLLVNHHRILHTSTSLDICCTYSLPSPLQQLEHGTKNVSSMACKLTLQNRDDHIADRRYVRSTPRYLGINRTALTYYQLPTITAMTKTELSLATRRRKPLHFCNMNCP